MTYRWPDLSPCWLAGLLLGLGLVASQAAVALELTRLGVSEVELDNPHDLKLTPDGRYLMISDVGYNRVVLVDPDTLDKHGEFGADHQAGTHDVEFDAEGSVYVADTHNNRVTIYTLDGLEARLVGELSERVRGPEGVLAHPNGRIYVAGAWSGNLVVYENGKLVGELGGLSSPHDVELAANGDIWLADAGNNRLLRLSPDLDILQELGGSPYNFNGVRYLDLTPQGMIIAADKNNHQVKFIDANGKIVGVLGDGRRGKGPNRLATPEGVELRDDILWLSDSGNDRILRYRMSH